MDHFAEKLSSNLALGHDIQHQPGDISSYATYLCRSLLDPQIPQRYMANFSAASEENSLRFVRGELSYVTFHRPGPRTGPCGTPAVIALCELSPMHYRTLSKKYLSIIQTTCAGVSIFMSALKIVHHCAKLNALRISSKTNTGFLLYLTLLCQKSQLISKGQIAKPTSKPELTV